MISRISVILLLLIVLPDIWLWHRLVKGGGNHVPRLRGRLRIAGSVVCSLFTVAMCVYTIWLATLPDFAPDDMTVLVVYLLLLCVVFIPKFLLTLCYMTGDIRPRSSRRRRVAMTVGVLLSAGLIYVVVCGGTTGFAQLTVTRLEYRSADIPEAFDGYRIVHFSDVHVGSYIGDNIRIPARAVDSINAQHADVIVFTGDLQNMKASEIARFRGILSRVGAADGVMSILGNHDYSEYIGGDETVRKANEEALVREERLLGWDVLIDDNRKIRRGDDSIVIVGMENVSDKPYFAGKGDMKKAMRGVDDDAFVVMLQHDPRAWRKRILPETNARLTLSGHTHAGQIKLFGWSPVSLIYDEWYGLYSEPDGRSLYVSAGLGGLVPFRYNTPGEITVITLRSDRP